MKFQLFKSACSSTRARLVLLLVSTMGILIGAPSLQAAITLTADPAYPASPVVFTCDPESLTPGSRGVTGTRRLRQTFQLSQSIDVDGIVLSLAASGTDGGLMLSFYEVADVNASTWSAGSLVKTISLDTSVNLPSSAVRLGLSLSGADIFTLPQRNTGSAGYGIEISNFDAVSTIGNLRHSNDGVDNYASGKFYVEDGSQSGTGVRDLGIALTGTATTSPPASSFGVTDNGTEFVVDTGAGLVFKAAKSSGTITSWVFNGTEYNGPSGKGSHIASGLGSTGTTVTATNTGSVVKITLQTDSNNGVVQNLTHYLVVTNGVNNVFMATYPTVEPGVGELRWITRLASTLLPNGPVPSDLRGNTGAIESSDVFGMADGTTRSKYYGDGVTHGKGRALELNYNGATGNNVGVWMVYGNRESSSGGPFFRDIQNQAGSDQEIYNYMNSGHCQTEANRLNVLHGPYVLVWNNGSAPTLPIDTSWLGSLGLTGWVGASDRGTVSGTASGLQTGQEGVVGLSNVDAQYWVKVNANGSYTISGVKPGTYTATLYQGELAVASTSVGVTAGTTATLNLASTWPSPSTIFKIGEWDGTPQGFLNATNILGYSSPNFITMHPSDVRMNTWGPVTFLTGTDANSKFNSIMMRGVPNNPAIKFSLTASQITNLTLKIGATVAYNGGRPRPNINGIDLSFPGTSSQPNSRSWTVGTYRGNNVLWTWTISSNNLVVGENTLTISPVSGSTDLNTWLSAGWVWDCVQLDGPTGGSSGGDTTPPAAPTGLTATAGNATVGLDWADNAESDLASYNVKRSTTSGGSYTTIATGVTTSAYTDNNVSNGTTYYYVVSAVDTSSNESANSSQASATPTAPSASTMHVASIQVDRVNAGGGKSKAQAVVTIVDNNGNPVANATVTVDFTEAIIETKSGVTDGNGVVTITTTNSASNPAKTTGCVSNVTHASLTYNAAANLATCDKSY